MTILDSEPFSSLGDLRSHLQSKGYALHSIEHLCSNAGKFLSYIEERRIALEAVQPANVAMFMRRQLQDHRRRHGRMPTNRKGWRTWCTDGVVQLLRFTHQQWPPARRARSAGEALAQSLCTEYRRWLTECRGLSASTIEGYLEEIQRFLTWYLRQGGRQERLELTVRHIDQYLQFRAGVMRRTTLKLVSLRLSGFLRFLHRVGHLSDDLSRSMIHPTLYEFENIPSVLRPEEITQILKVTRRDRCPRGRRDLAILMLLAMYWLSAGEIVRLALDDLDWRAETIVIRHSKVRGTTVLPLLPAVGEALLGYLRSGRPKTTAREVFIRMSAPLQGFSQKSVLHALVSRRIAAAGVRPVGKHGPHVFRHAHAVGLLRAAVPMKTISDLLGHRTSRSTAIYLKLDSEELRAVALPLPVVGGAS